MPVLPQLNFAPRICGYAYSDDWMIAHSFRCILDVLLETVEVLYPGSDTYAPLWCKMAFTITSAFPPLDPSRAWHR